MKYKYEILALFGLILLLVVYYNYFHNKSLVEELDNLSELKKIHPKIEKDIYKFIDPKKAIHAKNSLGGTSPKKVKAAIIAAKKTVSS